MKITGPGDSNWNPGSVKAETRVVWTHGTSGLQSELSASLGYLVTGIKTKKMLQSPRFAGDVAL